MLSPEGHASTATPWRHCVSSEVPWQKPTGPLAGRRGLAQESWAPGKIPHGHFCSLGHFIPARSGDKGTRAPPSGRWGLGPAGARVSPLRGADVRVCISPVPTRAGRGRRRCLAARPSGVGPSARVLWSRQSQGPAGSRRISRAIALLLSAGLTGRVTNPFPARRVRGSPAAAPSPGLR